MRAFLLNAVMALAIQSAVFVPTAAAAEQSTNRELRDGVFLACSTASRSFRFAAERLDYQRDVIASAEGRRVYLEETTTFLDKFIQMTPSLKAILLDAFAKGLDAQGDNAAARAVLGKITWDSAAMTVERSCVFRLGEISGQGQLANVIREAS